VSRAWPIVLTLVGCGRLGFDGSAPGADGGDASIEVAADLAALPCETDHAILEMLPRSDQIRVAFSGGFPYVIDIHHITDTSHQVNAYRLGERDGTLVGTELGVLYMLPDIAGLSVEPTSTGHVLLFSDPAAKNSHVVRVDGSFVLQGDAVAADFHNGLPPYARSSAGRMLAGIAGTNLQVRALDASFAPVGSPVTLASPADETSIAPAGADFIVAWTGSGVCSFARVSAAGAIVAGPISVDPGTTCTRPIAATLGSGRFAYVVHDVMGTTNYTAFGGTIDAALLTATPPVALGATPSFASELVVEGDRARMPLFNNGTVRIAELAATGTVSQIGADIGAVSYDAVWIQQIGGASILFRIEAKRLVVRKLCR
jgi:hypothetical protein